MIQDGKLRGFAMGQAIPVRTDYTAGEVHRFATAAIANSRRACAASFARWHDGEGLARVVPRSGQDQVLLSSAGEPARKSIAL